MNDDNNYHQNGSSESVKSGAANPPDYGEQTRIININPVDLQQDKSVKPKPSCLVLVYGETDLGKRFEINQDHMTIGRQMTCTLAINDSSVSRLHCHLHASASGEYFVSDNNSMNGTFVNNFPVRGQVPLHDGDYLKLGGVIFKFISGDNIEGEYYNEVYRLTTMDGLTQVYNKRYFLESLPREMSRATRYKRDLSLIMFDIDHFKVINDTHGHLAGDFALSKLAQTLSAIIRKEDIFCRYGGEEFAIILPEISLENACIFAEKIRNVVQNNVLEYAGKIIPFTISLGIAPFRVEMRAIEEFVKAADDCLYHAKRSGRNCSVYFHIDQGFIVI